ncbi:MAG: hypothetical protein IPQ07_29890 [Myxococcales bacterium]|nr:hypothetical protein [Myxococcales bacterium]
MAGLLVAMTGVALGCAAPPIGLGSGALHPAMPSSGASASGSAGYGGGRSRYVFQIDGSMAVAIRPTFAIETGAVYTQLDQVKHGTELTAYGVFPYLRPRIRVGPAFAAVALSGFAFGGGGGGVVAGIVDAQVGYRHADWAVYVGGYRLHHEVTGSSMTSAAQVRIGGEYLLPTRGGRIGVAVELYRQTDRLTGYEGMTGNTTSTRFLGGALKLRFASRWWTL